MWYTCTYNVQVSCVLFRSVVGMRVMRTWCRTSRQCVREIQHPPHGRYINFRVGNAMNME